MFLMYGLYTAEIDRAVEAGWSLGKIDKAIIQPANCDGDCKSTLWLYAWRATASYSAKAA